MNIKKILFDEIIARGVTASVQFADNDCLRGEKVTLVNYTASSCPRLHTTVSGIYALLSFGQHTDLIRTFLPWESVAVVAEAGTKKPVVLDWSACDRPVSLFEQEPARGDEVTQVTRMSKLRVIKGGKKDAPRAPSPKDAA